MDHEQAHLLARVLGMTETELRAALITIMKEAFETRIGIATHTIIASAVDATYNPIRRTVSRT